jgi:hypothetical protein
MTNSENDLPPESHAIIAKLTERLESAVANLSGEPTGLTQVLEILREAGDGVSEAENSFEHLFAKAYARS